MKATEQYFPVVLLIMLYKVVLIFESLDENLYCDHSDERYKVVLSLSGVHCFLFSLFWKRFQKIFQNCFFVPVEGKSWLWCTHLVELHSTLYVNCTLNGNSTSSRATG